jgi:hypothetical protein
MTVAVTDYASLTSAINDLTEGGYEAGETDRFIGLAEADFRLYFGPNFAKDMANTTLAFTSGSASLPAGFIRPIALIHSTYGALTERSIGAVREARLFTTSSGPNIFAVTGSTIEVGPSYTGNLSLDYEGTLTGLSNSNTTNWLVINAPQAYLAMCVHYAKAFDEDPAAPSYKAAALQMLSDLGEQSLVATHGRASVTIPGSTP